MTVYFPDGTPAPPILTPEEVCKILRIKKETAAQSRRTLDYYRTRGLRSIRSGKEVRYRLEEVLRFAKHLESLNETPTPEGSDHDRCDQ